MSLKLAARLVSFPPIKIADLQENDLVAHTLDLSSFIPPGTQGILLMADLMAGAGNFRLLPFGSTTGAYHLNEAAAGGGPALVAITNLEITWKNTVANDDWDLYLYGYFVQKRTR